MQGEIAPSELDAIGAKAVDTANIERQIMHQTGNDAEIAETERPVGAEDMQDQLRAVRRELRTIQTALRRMNREDSQGLLSGDGSAPAPLAKGELHEAVMQQRLQGLEAREASLLSALAHAGLEPDEIVPTEEALQNVLLTARKRRGSKAGKDGGAAVQFELEEDDLFDAASSFMVAAQGKGKGSLIETERDRLIRLGILTPFDRLGGFERRLEGTLPAAEAEASIFRVGEKVRALKAARRTSKLVDASELPCPQRPARKMDEGFWRAASSRHNAPRKSRRRNTLHLEASGRPSRRSRGDDGEEGESLHDEDPLDRSTESSENEEEKDIDASGRFDDADEAAFMRRQQAYINHKKRRTGAGHAQDDGTDGGHRTNVPGEEEEEEQEEVGGTLEEDAVFQGGFRIPWDIYSRLFDYQKTGVKWLWELHAQRCGGIIGDEMGLGKTVQIIAFLAGLHHSGMFRPSLIICPATVLRQWLRELRTWYPPFRVAILHGSAHHGNEGGSGRPSLRSIILQTASSPSGVLLTTYDQLRLRRDDLLAVHWGYAVLDEGHKIRNPDAEVTLTAKQLPTVHRLIMSGSPIQNRLTELWSLFDFVFPGKLGTLPVFQAQFAIPIQIGGYSNASPLQVSAAYKCAVILRDLISPYLLRRRKSDVAASLPSKTERVLFCTLTQEQRGMYQSYLASKELGEILSGTRPALAGIDILRKICNHPDLLERAKWEAAADYGNPGRSGKLIVLDRVLDLWHQQGHKVLVFTQTQQMLDIIERMTISRGWRYHRMDGGTPVVTRARLIDDFNDNPDVFAFLLTTRVGGIGVNLVGANRCVIYDPDWNPSTDVQARERAWRIGQSREVTVYRLISSGTIEEKVYHRQVYKQFLTDRVLSDPRQRRFFKARDLSDLFTLGDEYADGTETAAIFSSLDTEIRAGDVAGEEDEERGAGLTSPGSASDRDDHLENENTLLQQSAMVTGQEGGIHAITAGGSQAGSRGHGIAIVTGHSTSSEERGPGGSGDASILRDLFDGTGVHAALDHSKIEGAHDPDHRTAQREASKIAQRAAQALRQSRLHVQRAPVNRPTWTGRSGIAGAPRKAVPRFGAIVNPRIQPSSTMHGGRGALHSSDLLDQMRQRQAAVAAVAAAQTSSVSPEVAVAQTLAQRVAEFLHEQGGSAPSNEVAAAFQHTVGSRNLALFKSVLKQVALLVRENGSKTWVLRPEFAGTTGGTEEPS